jgi:hypothetical protein
VRNETRKNMNEEDAVASDLERAWGVTVPKLPDSTTGDRTHNLDRAVLRGSKASGRAVIGFVEIKCREQVAGTFKTVIINATKYASMELLRSTFNLPVLFVTKWADGPIWFYMMRGDKYPVTWWIDKHNAVERSLADTAVVHIPWSEFVRVEKLNPFAAEIVVAKTIDEIADDEQRMELAEAREDHLGDFTVRDILETFGAKIVCVE